jgi:betaine-aldehyde dehydrogenase
MNKTRLNWINGHWVAPDKHNELTSINPADGSVVGTFMDSGSEEAKSAIAAARKAFDATDWCRSPRTRAQVLLEIADRIEAHTQELSELLTLEGGKLLRETTAEVAAAVSESRYYAGLTRNIFSRTMEVEPDLYSLMAREPLGVIGIIVPWNAPIALLLRSLAPVLAAGCTAVVKAPAQTAIFNARLFELIAEIKTIPSGAINMFAESGSEGAETLVSSREVDGISYTGSTEVGKMIMAASAPTLKRLNLELGGDAPCIIFADVDLQETVPALVRAGMMMTGQYCCSASRVFVHKSIQNEALSLFEKELKTLVVGPGMEQESEMGPMIDNASRERVMNLVNSASDDGEIILRGNEMEGRLATGSFLSPSLVYVKSDESPIYQKEVFGPVLSVNSFSKEEEVITRANNTRYGLAASVWGSDLAALQRIASRLQSGTVWLNSHGRTFPEIENGGYKESGLGRLHGLEGLEAFMQTKHISWSVASTN